MNTAACCDFSDFLRAMSSETRQRILVLLREREMTVSEICAAFKQTQPTISYHLTMLRQANLVTARQDGKWVYYQANQDCVEECCQEILHRFPSVTLPAAESEENDV
jgi:ArsR family transcriptional regulator, arsenate/arsenite/antimonite-responsive transcriptional repressor